MTGARAIRALLLLAALAGPAAAQDGLLDGTLATVAARGTLRLGVREDAVPFSFHNRAGEPIGFTVDLCRQIAADIAATLHRELVEPGAPEWQQGVRLEFVTLRPEDRLPRVIDGGVDLECGSTTANADRARSVAFSPVFFLAGTKLLVTRAGSVGSYRDLAGRTVAVSAGTTNAEVIRRLAPTLSPPMTVRETPGVNDGYELLATGTAAALASDDILLAGLAATRTDGSTLRVVGDYLSYEPYAIMFRHSDPALAALVRASFERMAAEGTLRAAYNRWFTARLPSGATLDLPMSAHLAEMYRALGEPD